jgi:hypothetical protein
MFGLIIILGRLEAAVADPVLGPPAIVARPRTVLVVGQATVTSLAGLVVPGVTACAIRLVSGR